MLRVSPDKRAAVIAALERGEAPQAVAQACELALITVYGIGANAGLLSEGITTPEQEAVWDRRIRILTRWIRRHWSPAERERRLAVGLKPTPYSFPVLPESDFYRDSLLDTDSASNPCPD